MNVKTSKSYEKFDFIALNRQYVIKHHYDPNASTKHKDKLWLIEKNENYVMDAFSHIKLPDCIDTFITIEEAVKIAKQCQIMIETNSTSRGVLTLCKELNDLNGIDSLPIYYLAANDGTPYTWSADSSDYIKSTMPVINEALGYKNDLPMKDFDVIDDLDFPFLKDDSRLDFFKRQLLKIHN